MNKNNTTITPRDDAAAVRAYQYLCDRNIDVSFDELRAFQKIVSPELNDPFILEEAFAHINLK